MAYKKYNIMNQRLYQCWWNMKNRCDSSCRRDSKYYHDKGITYCPEWEIYENFQSWSLNNGYSDELTLDRINGNLGYSPMNCRWITIEEQQRNKSNCLIFTHVGETKTLTEWARIFNINRTTLHDRIFKLGYSFEEAIEKPKGSQKTNVFLNYRGGKYTQSEFSKIAGCTPQWVYKLTKEGFTPDEIMMKTEKLRTVVE